MRVCECMNSSCACLRSFVSLDKHTNTHGHMNTYAHEHTHTRAHTHLESRYGSTVVSYLPDCYLLVFAHTHCDTHTQTQAHTHPFHLSLHTHSRTHAHWQTHTHKCHAAAFLTRFNFKSNHCALLVEMFKCVLARTRTCVWAWVCRHERFSGRRQASIHASTTHTHVHTHAHTQTCRHKSLLFC
jgi:hypothetical protein